MSHTTIGPFVDADGHVVEPPDMLTRYIDPKFREVIPRHSLDPDGYDVLEPVKTGLAFNSGFFPDFTSRPNCAPNNAGRPWELGVEPFRKGVKGAWDPQARLADMDTDGIDVAVLYPTFALGFIEDAALYGAVCRAYNEWVADYCKTSPNRLFAVAAVALQDVAGAAAELRRCVEQHGFVGVFIRPNPYVGEKKLHDPVYDPFWRTAQDLEVAIGIHPFLMEDMPGAVRGMRLHEDIDPIAFKQALGNPFDIMTALASFTLGGILERFPRLRVAFLEANGGWVVPMLERYDHHFEVWHSQLPCKTKPSELFARGGYISFDVDEKTLTHTARLLGSDRLIWASDYPHPDAKLPGAIAELKETVAELSPEDQRRVIGRNAIDLYRLPI